MTVISAPTTPSPSAPVADARDESVARARYTRVMATVAALSGSAALVVAAAGLLVITH